MEVNITDVRALQCDCGSEEICICYSAPVFVYLNRKNISKVVVNDEDTWCRGVVRCMSCDRFWILGQEPKPNSKFVWQFGVTHQASSDERRHGSCPTI